MDKLFPDQKILVTKNFDIHQDWEVPIPSFFIIEPVRKIRSISEFTDEEAHEFITTLIKIRKGMQEILKIKDVYFFHNEDSSHGFHFWIFPRYEWMEKFGRKIQSVRPIIEYAKNNMTTDNNMKTVKDYAQKMGGFLKNNPTSQ